MHQTLGLKAHNFNGRPTIGSELFMSQYGWSVCRSFLLAPSAGLHPFVIINGNHDGSLQGHQFFEVQWAPTASLQQPIVFFLPEFTMFLKRIDLEPTLCCALNSRPSEVALSRFTIWSL
jgi:hypothetical protein